MPTFDFPTAKHKYPLLPGERDAFRVRPRPLPSEWVEGGALTLVSGGYATPGRLRLKPEQVEPVDAIAHYRRVLFCGATQTFKSGLTDVCAFWAMKFLGINGVISYAETDTARLVFKTRIREMIEKNSELRELWDGNDDNLTINNILLRGSFWRIASAQNINDLATFGAGFVIGSEVAKWERMSFNPVATLYGRQDAYPQELRKSIMESSPFEVGDYLYQEMYKDGVLILSPGYPCPVCGEYQILTDYTQNPDGSVKETHLKLRASEDNSDPSGKNSHSANRIRNEKEEAVFYECEHCHQEIRERDRVAMASKVKYMAPEIVEGDFVQHAEKVLKDGAIVDIEKRRKFNTVCFHWNRLVDLNFPFYECLARFFESVHNPEKKKVYDNETMARFTRKKTGRVEIGDMEKKKRPYYSSGQLATVPDGVLIVTAGIDAQDKSFYYVIQGWGEGMASWILRFGNIDCPIAAETIPARTEMFDKFSKGFLADQLTGSTGRAHSIRLGFIDRGGHRPGDVDFITSKVSFLQAYIGLTRVDPKKDLIYKSDNGQFFLGQSEALSEYVGMLMDTDMWYHPNDVTDEFIKQITGQYHIKKKTIDGNTRSIWVKDSNDHYRSCLNMSYAAAKLLNLDTALFNDRVIETLHKKNEEAAAVAKQQRETEKKNAVRPGNYFDRALGIR